MDSRKIWKAPANRSSQCRSCLMEDGIEGALSRRFLLHKSQNIEILLAADEMIARFGDERAAIGRGQ